MPTTSSVSSGAAIQISGLASGLDVDSIISKLMEVESLPKTLLQNKVTAQQSQLTVLQSLNTALAGIKSSAQSFTSSTTWTHLKASTTSTAFTATAKSSAVTGNHSIEVVQVATSAKAELDASSPLPANTTLNFYGADGNPLKDNDGNPITYTTDSDPTFDEIADAINEYSNQIGISATIIDTDDGEVLQLTSNKVGSTSGFSLSSDDNSFSLTATGDDAIIKVDNHTKTNTSSNTFTDVLTGVDITAVEVSDSGADALSIAADSSDRATAMQALVTQLNAMLSGIASQTSYGTPGTDGNTVGVLAGNSTVRSVATALTNALYPSGSHASNNYASAAQYGIDVDKNGQFTFDASKFADAFEADPDGATAALVGDGGFIDRVYSVADAASNSSNGWVTNLISQANTEIDSLNDNIDAFQTRLDMKQSQLENLYTNLETQISKMQTLSDWLTGQLDDLNNSK